MTDTKILKAAYALAGADDDVTVEDLQLLVRLAAQISIDNTLLNDSIEKVRTDEVFRQEMLDAIKGDASGTLNEVIQSARDSGVLSEGRVTMVLWRIATKLQLSEEGFNEWLAAAEVVPDPR